MELLQVRGSFWTKGIQQGMIQQKVLTAVINPGLFLTLKILLLLKWQFFIFFLRKTTRNLYLSIHPSIHLFTHLLIYLSIRLGDYEEGSGSQLLDDNMLAADDLVTSEGTKIKISDKVNTIKKTWKILSTKFLPGIIKNRDVRVLLECQTYYISYKGI